MSDFENELEERYPVADGANEQVILSRQELMHMLRSAYSAGAKRHRAKDEPSAIES